MKRYCVLILISFVAACITKDKTSEHKSYCQSQLQLLNGWFSRDVLIDFTQTNAKMNLNIEEKLKDIQEPPCAVNAQFVLSTADTVCIPLFADEYCPENMGRIAMCFKKNIEVLINRSSQVLLEGELMGLDSLTVKIEGILLNNYIKTGDHYVIFYIRWDDETPVANKRKAFKAIIDGYLNVTEKLAIHEFGVDICILDSTRIVDLKSKFKLIMFNYGILPPPLPPSMPSPANDSLLTEVYFN